MYGILIQILIFFFISVFSLSTRGDITVKDDLGNIINLTQPANRIVSLAPNLTELLFSAGAGEMVIATVRYSDYPPQARDLPRVGDAHNVDLEAITVLMPDLIVSWRTGTSSALPDRLSTLGFTVYQSEADTLEKIATTIERFGVLAGSEDIARRNSREFRREINVLGLRYSSREKIRVFYQFWNQPMYTVNGQHLITRFLELCGGENIFSGLDSLTPNVDIESVLTANPQVIIASGNDENKPIWLDHWQAWPEIDAVSNDHIYFIPPDLIQRHTARSVHGIRSVCDFIDRAR